VSSYNGSLIIATKRIATHRFLAIDYLLFDTVPKKITLIKIVYFSKIHFRTTGPILSDVNVVRLPLASSHGRHVSIIHDRKLKLAEVGVASRDNESKIVSVDNRKVVKVREVVKVKLHSECVSKSFQTVRLERENCTWYSSLPLGAVLSLFCESV
jgi:hypothetical protein